MADKGLYLIDVTVKPYVHGKDVIDGSWTNLSEGSKDAGNGKVIYGFKVGSVRHFEMITTGLCDARTQQHNVDLMPDILDTNISCLQVCCISVKLQ